MERQHVITLAASLAIALTGCAPAGAPTVAVPKAPVKAASGVVSSNVARAQAPAPMKVNKQHASIQLTPAMAAPEAIGTGAIAMEFVFRNKGYALQATVADVAKIVVTLKTRSFLLMKTVATAEVTKGQMLNGRAAVNFTGLKAGSYTVDVEAQDADAASLAITSASADVKDGETTTVDAKLQVTPTVPAAADPTGGGATGIGVNLEIL